MTNKEFIASAWRNNSLGHKTGAVFGVSINVSGHNILEQILGLQTPNKVELRIDGDWVSINITDTFWTTCPEWRKKEIGAWLIANKRDDWELNNPTKIRVTHLGDNRFALAFAD